MKITIKNAKGTVKPTNEIPPGTVFAGRALGFSTKIDAIFFKASCGQISFLTHVNGENLKEACAVASHTVFEDYREVEVTFNVPAV